MHQVEEHYTHGELEQTILQTLEKAGKNLDQLTLDDLASIDEFHIRGPEATQEMAEEIGIKAAMQVLDVGLAWFAAQSAEIKKHGPPALGYHILLGDDFPQMARNQLRSFKENRMALLQVIAQRSAP